MGDLKGRSTESGYRHPMIQMDHVAFWNLPSTELADAPVSFKHHSTNLGRDRFPIRSKLPKVFATEDVPAAGRASPAIRNRLPESCANQCVEWTFRLALALKEKHPGN